MYNDYFYLNLVKFYFIFFYVLVMYEKVRNGR